SCHDVVEGDFLAGALADGIDKWVDKTDTWSATGCGLLIDQGGEPRPQRRRCAGAAHDALLAVVRDEPDDIVREAGDIRNVPHARGSLVGGHLDAPLPDRDFVSGADAAATAEPRGFRQPGTARIAGRQGGTADHRDERVIRWWRDRPGPRAPIAGGLKERLPLRGKLQEDLFAGGVHLRPEAPRRTESPGRIVRSHAVQDIVRD